jgi:hypothetical protein
MNVLLAAVVFLCLSVAALGAENTKEKTPPVSGTVYDNYGNRKGEVRKDGVVLDNYGNRQGYIKEDGTVYDNYGNRKGQIKKP